jgi:hypothetical protein
MIRKIQDAMSPAKGSSLAKAFWRLGWTGFWVQIILGSLPVALMLYYLLFTKVTADPRRGVPFVELLTMANLAILVFTILWSFRYTRLAKRIADPARRPGEAAVSKTAWTGVTASYFLKAPQAGMPVIQTGASESIHWVSTIDVLSMVALTLTLIAEIIVLMLSLWLLFRTTVSSPEYPKPEVA